MSANTVHASVDQLALSPSNEQEPIVYVFAKKESALLFLSRKHPLLAGRSPLDVARESTAGADLVLKLLARAEAGISV